MIYIFIFRCVSTLKVKIIIILLTDQPKIILPTAIQQKIKLPSPNTKFTNQAQSKIHKAIWSNTVVVLSILENVKLKVVEYNLHLW